MSGESKLDRIKRTFLGGIEPVEPIGKTVGQVKAETEAALW